MVGRAHPTATKNAGGRLMLSFAPIVAAESGLVTSGRVCKMIPRTPHFVRRDRYSIRLGAAEAFDCLAAWMLPPLCPKNGQMRRRALEKKTMPSDLRLSS